MARNKKQANFKSTAFLIGLVAIALVALFFFRKQQVYKSRYKALIANIEAPQKPSEKVTTTSKVTAGQLELSQEVADHILNGLSNFEKEKGFLQNDLTVGMLAKRLETNVSYLSKFLKHYKGMTYSNYIKDLRVNYAISELKTSSQLRNYTIKAIAEAVGFNNAESFSKAFYKETGIYPSYYVKQLNKNSA